MHVRKADLVRWDRAKDLYDAILASDPTNLVCAVPHCLVLMYEFSKHRNDESRFTLHKAKSHQLSMS